MSDAEDSRSSMVTSDRPASTSPSSSQQAPATSPPDTNKDEASRDGSVTSVVSHSGELLIEDESMDAESSILTGTSSPVGSQATTDRATPGGDNVPDEDFEIDTSETSRSALDILESSVRRRPKGDGYYRQLDEGLTDKEMKYSASGKGKKRRRRVSASSGAPGKLAKATEIDPLWLIPFEHGWKRQVIIRATNTSMNDKKSADTYYHPPTGRKLRSMPEIEKYLIDMESELTTANFTFRKEAIYDEPYETVRHAKAPGSSNFFKTKKPKINKSEESSPKDSVSKKGHEVSKKGHEVVSVANSVLTVFKSSEGGGEGGVMTAVKSTARKHTGKRTSLFDSPDSAAKKPREDNNGNGVVDEPRLCGFECPGRGGVPPSLHCEVCMCCFHPECVGHDRTKNRDGFTCKSCRNVESGLGKPKPASTPTAAASRIIKVPMLRPQPPRLMTRPMTAISNIQLLARTTAPAPTPTRVMVSRPLAVLSGPSALSAAPTSILSGGGASSTANNNKPPIRIPASFDPNNISGQLITLPPSLTSKLNLSKSVNLKWGGQSFIIPPNCFINTPDGLKVLLPAGTLTNNSGGTVAPSQISAQATGGGSGLTIVNTASLAQSTLQRPPRHFASPLFNMANNSNSNTNSTSGVTAPQAVTTVSPARTTAASFQPQGQSPVRTTTVIEPQVIAPIGNDTEPIEIGADTTIPAPMNALSPIEIGADTTIPAPVIALSPEPASTNNGTSQQTSLVSKNRPRVRVKKVNHCHVSQLQGGFDAMISIFKYLRPAQLLNCRLVCQSWNSIATCSVLWRRPNFRRLTITHYKKAGKFLRSRNTQVLDLRGGEDERSWQEFAGCLRMMTDCVEVVTLPQCPGHVLQALTESLPQLQSVTALAIVDPEAPKSNYSRVAVAKFGGVSELRELRLRGSRGMQLPSFSIGGGLSELGKLSHLKTLSLTTMVEVPELEFSFLSSLTELETLELGDCILWTQKTYDQLGDLTKLTTLRLECGGESIDGLGPALEKLTKLKKLELIRFPVTDDLGNSLQKLTSVEHFSIWPDTDTAAAAVNQATKKAVSEMQFLSTLEWGVSTTDNLIHFPKPEGAEDAAEGGGGAGEETEAREIRDVAAELLVCLTTNRVRVYKVPAQQRRHAPELHAP